MTRTLLPLTAALILGSGCSMAGDSGIWVFFIEPGDGQECEETVTHNFSGASVPDDTQPTGEWVNETEESTSDAIVFGQMFSAAGEDKMILVIGDRTYLGNKDGGEWLFSWEAFQSETDSEVHDMAGYSYTRSFNGEVEERYSFEISGNSLEGTLSFSRDQTTAYTESDEWDPMDMSSDVVYAGQTPSFAYLVDSQDQAVYNNAADPDCTGAECNLQVARSCSGSSSFTGRQTSYDEDAYYGVSEAGQPWGIPAM